MIETEERNKETIIKIGLVFNSILWGVYGYFINLYPVMIFNGITFILSVLSIINVIVYFKKKKKEKALD